MIISNGHKQYDILVGAKGYQETKAKISIQHCIGSCLVNRAFVTIVSESAKLVTIKGLVKIYSAGYNEKGKIVSSEKIVAGAPVQFRRSTMVSFFTKSDIDGNYNITVPAGAYSVYATAAPGCYMCAEYFGNIVGDKDPTNLNITLRFYGEGNLKILKTSDQGELNKIINNEQFNIWNNQARCGSDGESGEDCFAYFGRWVQDSRDEIDTSDAEAG